MKVCRDCEYPEECRRYGGCEEAKSDCAPDWPATSCSAAQPQDSVTPLDARVPPREAEAGTTLDYIKNRASREHAEEIKAEGMGALVLASLHQGRREALEMVISMLELEDRQRASAG